MPLRRFWLMQGNIGRISAAEDQRRLRVLTGANGGKEALDEVHHSLIEEIGMVQRIEEKLDREGLQRLAELA